MTYEKALLFARVDAILLRLLEYSRVRDPLTDDLRELRDLIKELAKQ